MVRLLNLIGEEEAAKEAIKSGKAITIRQLARKIEGVINNPPKNDLVARRIKDCQSTIFGRLVRFATLPIVSYFGYVCAALRGISMQVLVIAAADVIFGKDNSGKCKSFYKTVTGICLTVLMLGTCPKVGAIWGAGLLVHFFGVIVAMDVVCKGLEGIQCPKSVNIQGPITYPIAPRMCALRLDVIKFLGYRGVLAIEVKSSKVHNNDQQVDLGHMEVNCLAAFDDDGDDNNDKETNGVIVIGCPKDEHEILLPDQIMLHIHPRPHLGYMFPFA